MLGINYGSNATELLGLGYGMDGQSGLTRRFGTEDLNYSAARVAPHAQGIVETDRAGGDHLDIHYRVVAELHDRALAIVFLDLAESFSKGFELGRTGIGRIFFRRAGHLLFAFFCCHIYDGVEVYIRVYAAKLTQFGGISYAHIC